MNIIVALQFPSSLAIREEIICEQNAANRWISQTKAHCIAFGHLIPILNKIENQFLIFFFVWLKGNIIDKLS